MNSKTPKIKSIESSGLLPPNKWDILVCSLLIFSFCYELPVLVITPFDKFNPRLFDIVTFFALFTTRWRINKKHPIVRAWIILSIIFISMGILSFLFILPKPFGYFSLFYSFKYLEGVFALIILTGFFWSKSEIEQLFKYFCFGLILAGIVGCLQFCGILKTTRTLPTGVDVTAQTGTILSTLGNGYFHAGTIGAMGACLLLALRQSKGISIFIFIPAFVASIFLATFSGSRTALGFLFLSVTILFSVKLKTISSLIIFIILILMVLFLNDNNDQNATLRRLDDSNQIEANSFSARLFKNVWNSLPEYWNEHGIRLLFLGGGFYAVPLGGHYRVGYGIHNCHLFPLEQAGLAGFFAALFFWYITLKTSYRQRKDWYGRCGFSIATAIAIFSWFGAIFYFSVSTEDLVICEVVLMSLLTFNVRKEKSYILEN